MNQCKIHQVAMKEIGFERGYRIWHCEECEKEFNNKDYKNKKIKQRIKNVKNKR